MQEMATMIVGHERLLHRSNTIKENRALLRELSARGDLANKSSRETSRLFARLNAENAEELTRGMRTYEPAWHNKKATNRLYGPIPERPSGSWWGIRMDCSRDRVHDPFSASVQGGPVGAVSLCTTRSKEDVDFGDCFTFTGQRYIEEEPAYSNREQTLGNNSLLLSFKNQIPVRVIRGYSLSNEYSPKTGYRYDGLYMVVACWIGISPGTSASTKCYKFAFKRLKSQEPPPWNKSGPKLSSPQPPLVPRHPSLGTQSPKDKPVCDTIVARCPSRKPLGTLESEFPTSRTEGIAVDEAKRGMHEVETEYVSDKLSDKALMSTSSSKTESMFKIGARVTRCSAKKFSTSLKNVSNGTASWSMLPNNKTNKKCETSPSSQNVINKHASKSLQRVLMSRPGAAKGMLAFARADTWNGTQRSMSHDEKWERSSTPGLTLDGQQLESPHPKKRILSKNLQSRSPLAKPTSKCLQSGSAVKKTWTNSIDTNRRLLHGLEHSYARPCVAQKQVEETLSSKKEAKDSQAFFYSKQQNEKNSVVALESVRRTRSSGKTDEFISGSKYNPKQNVEKDPPLRTAPEGKHAASGCPSPVFRGFGREEVLQPLNLRATENCLPIIKNVSSDDTSVVRSRCSAENRSGNVQAETKAKYTDVKGTNSRNQTDSGENKKSGEPTVPALPKQAGRGNAAVSGVRRSIRSLRVNAVMTTRRTRNEKNVARVKRDLQKEKRNGGEIVSQKKHVAFRAASFRTGNGSVKSKLHSSVVRRLTRSNREQGRTKTTNVVAAVSDRTGSKHSTVSEKDLGCSNERMAVVPKPVAAVTKPVATQVPNFKISYNNPERFMMEKAVSNVQQNGNVVTRSKNFPPKSNVKQRGIRKRRKSKTSTILRAKLSGSRSELKLRSAKSEKRRRLVESGSKRLSKPNAEIANLAIDMNMSPKTQMHGPTRLGRGQRKRTSDIATHHPSCPQKRPRTVRTAERLKQIEKKNSSVTDRKNTVMSYVRGDSMNISLEKPVVKVRGTKFEALGSRSVKPNSTVATQRGSLPLSETYARRRRAAQLKKQQQQIPNCHHEDLKLALNKKKLQYTLYREIEMRKPKMMDVSTQCALRRTSSSSSSSSSSFDGSCQASPIRGPRIPVHHNTNNECPCRSLRAGTEQSFKTEVIDLVDVKSETFEDDRTYFEEVTFEGSEMLDANAEDQHSDTQPIPAGPSYPLLLSGNRDWDPVRSAWAQQASTRSNQKKEESGDCGSPRVKGFVRYVSRRPSAFVPVNSVEGSLRSAQLKSIGFKPIRPGLLSSASSSSDPRCRSTSDSPRIAYASAVARRAVNEEYERYTSEENSVVRYMDAELRYQDIEDEDNFQVEYNEAASDEITIDKVEFTKVGVEERSVDEDMSPAEPEDSKQWHSELGGTTSLASDNTEQEVTEQEMLRRYTVPPLEEDPAVPWHGWRKIIANEQTYWVGW